MSDRRNYKNKIDPEADFRAGGFHNTYSHQFEQDVTLNSRQGYGNQYSKRDYNGGNHQQRNQFYYEDYPYQQDEGFGNPNPGQWSGNKQYDVYSEQYNRRNDEDNFPKNRNYGWKKGFNRNEMYGSQLLDNPHQNLKTSRGGRTGFGGRKRS